MERSNGKTKVPKLRASNENVHPLQIDSEERRGRYYLQPTAMSPRFQRYAENIDAGSPLARYLFAGSPLSGKVASAGEAFVSPMFGARTAKALQYRGTSSGSGSSFGSRGRLTPSPLSSLENMEIASVRSPPILRTPSTGDDDVIVMDAILVRPVAGGKSGRSSSSSGRGSSSSSSSTAKSVFKTEICKAREESGSCRYNSKCQFGNVKEEFRKPFWYDRICKLQEEAITSCVGAGTSTHGTSSDVDAAIEYDDVVSTSQPTTSKSGEEATSAEPHDALTDSNDWSPLDDGILVVVLPGSDEAPSREQVDAYISGIQHGRTPKRRLPVFEEFCKGD